MKLLLADDALAARVEVAHNELASLAQGLASELHPLTERELYIPKEKALLSRVGGRCEHDGSMLEFDPFSPHRHRCPTCGAMHIGELHDRYWVFWYQLWLAERAVHGALLGRLLCDDGALALSAAILERYADVYLLYPNRDNVLGPTRLFFSTYLESIWLLNLCVAIDLLEEGGGAAALGARVRERVLEPSAALIASYDEGASNRQVWNDAALVAAARLLDREEQVEAAVFGRSGVVYHLENGLLADGTWYEGENYHLFAHRGLWYGLTMAERAGLELPNDGVARFDEGFATPFLTALPDMTLPSRRDSQYAISLRQPRFAELCELGLAREKGDGDPRLRAVLRHLYGDPYPQRDNGRWNSTADVERNLPGTHLSRADLGWRSLLFARRQLPPLADAPLGSVLLDAQGIAVFRREHEHIYIALDYGTSGGGHGHPDRLNVLLADGAVRWLDDMGTGSYVDPSLHWYRSTLAHNAPLFNGCEQQRVDGELFAFEERQEAGWVCARAFDLFPGVAAMRTLVAMPHYVLDELAWEANRSTVMDLPIHIEPAAVNVRRSAPHRHLALLGFTAPLEDTLGVLQSSTGQLLAPGAVARITARHADRTLNGLLLCSVAAIVYRVSAPGAPGRGRQPFIVVRAPSQGETTWIRIVWDWTGDVESIRADAPDSAIVVERRDGSHDRLRQTISGYRIERVERGETHQIELGGFVGLRPSRRLERAEPSMRGELSQAKPLVLQLGPEQYRRSEDTWEEAGRPTARLKLSLEPNDLVLDILVRKSGDLTFVPGSARNPYDNECPDINGDGVQLYLADADGASGWVLVPETDDARGSVRARPIDGWASPRRLRASWNRTGDGYSMSVRIGLAPWVVSDEIALAVVVNEKPPGRERRRGQLVLGGAPGEFIYLRGDRESRDRMPRFTIVG